MKTFMVVLLLLFGSVLSAQTRYYDKTKTFNENGYTYQCDVPSYKMVTLYNKANKLTYVDMVYKDTGKMPPMNVFFPRFEDDDWTKPKCHSIVNNAFSTAEKQRLKGAELGIMMYLDSQTGKVIEVGFNFTTTNPFATIPVSVYRQIELELKQNIWFVPTAEGRRFNYLICAWRQEVKGSSSSLPSPDDGPVKDLDKVDNGSNP